MVTSADDDGKVDESADATPDVSSIDTAVSDAEIIDADIEAPAAGEAADGSDDAVGAIDGQPDVAAPDDAAPDERTVAEQRDEYLDALRRIQADFENYRKRSIKQQSDAVDYATARIVEDLLPVLDACEAGIEHGDEGVTAIFTSLLGVLEKRGLERVSDIDVPFDPNQHEAVLHEPADDGPNVVQVMRTGYIWKGKVVRAAMVKVRG